MIENLKRQLGFRNNQYSYDNLKLYGLFSGGIYEKLWTDLSDRWGFNYASLFEGGVEKQLKTVAPYLVELTYESKHTDEILKNYGQNGCIFFCTELKFDDALQRMREIFNVRDEREIIGYLRFYSPDIFRVLIENHNLDLLHQMFEKITCYYCESEDEPRVLNRYSYNEKSLQVKSLSLIKN